MAREKILVVNEDLDFLSKIYLALIHRKFKVEACNNPQEIRERLKRFKPLTIILNLDEYRLISEKLKIPAIVIIENEPSARLNDGDIPIKKPVQIEELLQAVKTIV